MRFLHTSDWHLGQTFYGYDRFDEHQNFLDWLFQAVKQQNVDVLLVSGDVFDMVNPSVASTRQFYQFLNRLTMAYPCLQIIITAGNHDSPIRLEMPSPLLQDTRVHLIGQVRKDETQAILYEDLIIPLKNKEGETEAFCLAVPFLRWGDYPKNEDGQYDYFYGVSTFYNEITQSALNLTTSGQPLIAMGHLHAAGAEMSENDTAEREIIGGVERIGAQQFSDALTYVALGHIHKAQKIGGKEHIRYSGSPIPLSFSERKYRHQVILFDVINQKLENIEPLLVPVSVPLISIPEKHRKIDEVLYQLENEALFLNENDSVCPFLEVRVLIDEPIPDLKNQILKALEHKKIRLARIDVKIKKSTSSLEEQSLSELELNHLQPVDIFQKLYYKSFNEMVPEELNTLFRNAIQELDASEQE